MQLHFVLAICVLFITASHALNHEERNRMFPLSLTDDELFTRFVAYFNHADDTDYDLVSRKTIFSDNLRKIRSLNAEGSGTTYGITKFSDMSSEERQSYTMSSDHQIDTSESPATNQFASSNTAVPSSYCLLEDGYLTPVRDQGSCGSCWAFATVNSLETNLLYVGSGQALDLAEQTLVDCVEDNSGCQGGSIPNTVDYVFAHGVPYEAEQPYKDRETSLSCPAEYDEEVYPCTSDTNIISSTGSIVPASSIKNAILSGLNLIMYYDASDAFSSYSSGVYRDTTCFQGTVGNYQGNHFMSLVGWESVDGIDCWKVANSWSENWGDDGFVFFPIGENVCGSEQLIYVVLPPSDLDPVSGTGGLSRAFGPLALLALLISIVVL
eukprot:gnl/Dysnectes_brevis/1233_a1377_3100.p1 GENE.gnl/Dysnectes_brevis/1233_a1377_3100~~gnl/Dysnectes_brevis/1233_a1377_3100.p1  ORF type:complete len:381 (+),score=114.80 gnl/Dysnectes_brevis/1233_a1377_3100:43-1185(+)